MFLIFFCSFSFLSDTFKKVTSIRNKDPQKRKIYDQTGGDGSEHYQQGGHQHGGFGFPGGGFGFPGGGFGFPGGGFGFNGGFGGINI